LRRQKLVLELQLVHHIADHAGEQLSPDQGEELVIILPEFHGFRPAAISGSI
jgi:hypothetical protein